MVTPNQLTLLGILLAFVCPAFLVWHRTVWVETIVVILFTIACITDWWDGYLARAQSKVTSLGKIIDPIADKLLILGVMSVFVWFGLYRIEWILLIFIREFSVSWIRLVRVLKHEVLPAEWAGKLKVGFQIISVYATFIYLIILDSAQFGSAVHPKVWTAVFVFHHAAIALATMMTILSGMLFFRRLGEP